MAKGRKIDDSFSMFLAYVTPILNIVLYFFIRSGYRYYFQNMSNNDKTL